MSTPSPSARFSGVPGPRKGMLADWATMVVTDARSGATCSLETLWREQPVVILFLRRLGCALCRVTALEYSDARGAIEGAGAALVAVSFEAFGTGSDRDRSFERGQFFTGPVYTVAPAMYESLFGRKGLFNSFYGLADMSRTKLASCTERGVTGNLKGDGMLLGGQFVVEKGGRVIREKRQAFFGDDLTVEDVITALRESVPRPRPAVTSSALALCAGVAPASASAAAGVEGAADAELEPEHCDEGC